MLFKYPLTLERRVRRAGRFWSMVGAGMRTVFHPEVTGAEVLIDECPF